MNDAINLHWNNEISVADGLQGQGTFIELAVVIPQLHSRGPSSDVNANNLAPSEIHWVVMTNEVFRLVPAQVQEKQLLEAPRLNVMFPSCLCCHFLNITSFMTYRDTHILTFLIQQSSPCQALKATHLERAVDKRLIQVDHHTLLPIVGYDHLW